MIGSLLGQMANAQKMSIEQIQRSLQNGTLDAYIAIPLIEQKAKEAQKLQMAKAILQEQGTPPTTVKDQVMQAADQVTRPEPPVMPSTPDGYRQQPAPSQGVETLPSNMPEEYAGGGIIAFAGGGSSDETTTLPDTDVRTARERDSEDNRYTVTRGAQYSPARPIARPSSYAGIQDLYSQYMNQLPAGQQDLRNIILSQQADRPQREQDAIANAIREGGFTAAAARTPWMLTNLAEGALAGTRAYSKGMEQLGQRDENVVKQLLATGLRGQELQQQALRYGIDLSQHQSMEPYYASMEARNLSEAGLDPLRARLIESQAGLTSAKTEGQGIENLYGAAREEADIEEKMAHADYFRRPPKTTRAAGTGKIDPAAYQMYQDASGDPQFQSALADAMASGEKDPSGNPVGDSRFWRREVQRILKDPTDKNYSLVMQYMQRLMPSYMQHMRRLTTPPTPDYSSDEE